MCVQSFRLSRTDSQPAPPMVRCPIRAVWCCFSSYEVREVTYLCSCHLSHAFTLCIPFGASKQKMFHRGAARAHWIRVSSPVRTGRVCYPGSALSIVLKYLPTSSRGCSFYNASASASLSCMERAEFAGVLGGRFARAALCASALASMPMGKSSPDGTHSILTMLPRPSSRSACL